MKKPMETRYQLQEDIYGIKYHAKIDESGRVTETSQLEEMSEDD